MSKTATSLKSCAACIILVAILIPLGLNNISLFLFTTDICWSILNYLDESQIEYNGYVYLHDAAYSPVTDEIIDYNLKVIGKIPQDCDGVIFKIGSNPRWKRNVGIKYNWFDGDGMVHAIKLISNNNTAHYSNAFMNTIKYNLESKYNRSIYFNIFGSSHANGIIGFIKLQFGRFITDSKYSPVSLINLQKTTDQKHKLVSERGEANTAIIKWNNKLFALHEASPAFEFKYNSKTSQLSSVGYYDFNDSWNMAFTAHPKIDKDKEQLFTHAGYIEPRGDVIVGMTDGKNPEILIKSKKIKLNAPQMMHEMMVTEKYIIVLDLNEHFGKDAFIQSNFTRIFNFNNGTNGRIGIIVRDQLLNQKKLANIRWFDIEPCWVFHLANGWDEDDVITLIGHRYAEFDMNLFQLSFDTNITQIMDHELYRWRISLREGGKVEEGPMNVGKLYQDGYYPVMPLVNPDIRGKKNRFMFSALYKDVVGMGYNRKYIGILKYDFEQENVVKKILYDEESDNGNTEFVIIPKKDGVEEDDVYIGSLVFNYKTDKTRLVIYDGKSMNDKPVATVFLNSKVPIGFHGMFVSQDELNVMDEL